MMDRIARGVGYVTMFLSALFVSVLLLITLNEFISGADNDRKCEELALETGGESVDLRQWGDCSVEWENEWKNFQVHGGAIDRRYP